MVSLAIFFSCCIDRSRPTVGVPSARPLSDVLRMPEPVLPGVTWTQGGERGPAMSTPVRASDQDLRALAAIVSQDRPDLPDEEGLPPSLMADLKDQIRCDGISLERFDSELRASRFLQGIPALGDDGLEAYEDLNGATWPLYWDCQPCSYPERTGDTCAA